MHEELIQRPGPPRDSVVAPVAPYWHTALLAGLLIGISALSVHQAHRPGLTAHHSARYLTGIVSEWALLLLTWWGVRLRHRPFADLIGFRRGWRALAQDFAAAGVFWIAALVILAAVAVVLRLLHLRVPQQALHALAPGNAREMLLWILLSLSAGFCEECVFRGYFLRQLSSPLHRVWIGVLGSSLLFGISHGYEGAAGMIAITVYGALFCALALALRSLRPGMIAHAWHDIFSGVMLLLLRHVQLP
jgi:membrane protease YdiL (CAAX protease family)